eukprot:10704267-Alexandrium_andersonii.AAC.1
MVPQGLPGTSVVARLFSGFRELYGMCQRLNQESSQKMQDFVNRTRRYRSLDPGEVVFRRRPGPARLPKWLFSEPSTEPYVVVRMPTDTSVILATLKGEP